MRQTRWSERLLLTYLGVLGVTVYVVAWDPDWSSMDSSDVVALAAVVASAVVAGAALLVAARIAAADRSHATELAIADRRQARLESAYVEALAFAAAAGAWAQALLPPAEGVPSDPAREAPPLPGDAAEWSMAAQVAAFGSDEVRAALETWRLALRDVRSKVHLVRSLEQAGDGSWSDPWVALEDAAMPAERSARRRLQELVVSELESSTVARAGQR